MRERAMGTLEVVRTFDGPMPTAASVSRSGRIFVNLAKWGEDVPATVVELRDGTEVPYPEGAWNQPSADDDDTDALVDRSCFEDEVAATVRVRGTWVGRDEMETDDAATALHHRRRA